MTLLGARVVLGVAVIVAAVPAAGSSSEIPIAGGPGQQAVGTSAFDGTNFLVGVQDKAAGTSGGKLISPSGAVLATAAALVTGDPPIVGFDGTNYLLVWADHSAEPSVTARGMLVSTAGAVVGSPFLVSQATTVREANDVAFDGTNYLVTWTDRRNVGPTPQPGDKDVYGRFVSPGGTTVGNDFLIAGSAKDSSLAFLAPNYLVAWSENYYDRDVNARFVSPAGTLGPQFTVNASTARSDNPVRVATDGLNFLVVWSDLVDEGTGDIDLLGQLVDPSGSLLGFPIDIATSSGAQLAPFIAFDGANYLVTWTDFRNDANGDFVCDSGEGQCSDIAGTFLTTVGTPLGSEFPISIAPGNEGLSPVVYGAGKYLVAWSNNFDLPASDVNGTLVPVDLVFRDDLESGTFAAWSAVSLDGGDLHINSTAALDGAFDLEGVIDDTNPLYVQDDRPFRENHYRARFRIDPSGFDPGMAQSHFRVRAFLAFEQTPLRRLLAVVLKRQGAQFSLMGRCRLDDNSQADTGFFNVSAGPHTVEVEWTRASFPSADGEFRLWIDGTLRSTLTGLANGASAVDLARLGALSLKAGSSGILHWDGFESRRETYIGP